MLVDHPDISLVEQIVHIFGIPSIIAALVWLVRTYDKGVREVKEVREDAAETKRIVMETHGGVQEIKTNHLAHLQDGISQLAASNDKAVDILQNIDKGITVLVDRDRRI